MAEKPRRPGSYTNVAVGFSFILNCPIIISIVPVRMLTAAILALAVVFAACKDPVETIDPIETIDPVTVSIVESLDKELESLSPDPINWGNDELKFLDAYSNHAILGLGEATHGTSEFFKAKHRILRYMVEKHGFKIFAIEADFGESILINQAVLAGDKSQIESLMTKKMHFWTWRTTEVRDMLYWMCDYNVGKPEAQKVQYWGVDCQFNTYHPDMLRDTIELAALPFISFARDILTEAKTASTARFSGYTTTAFNSYLNKIHALKDSLIKYEEHFTGPGLDKQYPLTLQLADVIGQASEVIFYAARLNATKNYRDEYMATNTTWLHEHFNNAKIVLWEHNYHISDHPPSGSMGSHLKVGFPTSYGTLGFLFSKGTFTAATVVGNSFQGLNDQSLEDDPEPGSMNDAMYRAKTDVFTVGVGALQKHDEWNQAFASGIRYFQMGSVYNKKPASYYSNYNAGLFDRLIYIERSTAARQLQSGG